MKFKRKVTKKIAAWLMCLAVVLTTINLPALTTEVKAASNGYDMRFFYGAKDTSIRGGVTCELSSILEKLGVTGDVSSAVSSNTDCFEVAEENGAWYVTNKNVFGDTETLTVIVDSVEYNIWTTCLPDSLTVVIEDTLYFDLNGGSGSMEGLTGPDKNGYWTRSIYIGDGKAYILPECGFTAPTNMEFAAWEIDGKKYEVGYPYIFKSSSSSLMIKAIWKEIEADCTVTGNHNFLDEDGKPTATCKVCQAENPNKCGGNAYWYLAEDGTFYVTGEGAMGDTDGLHFAWAGYLDDIKTVDISEGITRIGVYSFGVCPNLETVRMPGVTDIGNYAFANCGKLKEIDLSNVEEIGEGAFVNDTALESVDLSSATAIHHNAFEGCSSLMTVYMPSVETFEVEEFKGCSNLTEVTIPCDKTDYFNDSIFDESVCAKDDVLKLAHRYENNVCLGCGKCKSLIETGEHNLAGQSFISDGAGNHYMQCPDCEELTEKIACADSEKTVVGKKDSTETEAGYTGDTVCADCGYVLETGEEIPMLVVLAGWQKVDGKWKFYKDGVAQTGWIKDGGKWYYFDADGNMKTGWVKDGGKWYYMASSGVMSTGWKQIKDVWYYFGTNGVMVTGWQKISNKWYYFEDGAMVTGWKKLSNKWYYFDDGAMVDGWKKLEGKWYYFDDGAMTTGWKKLDNKWYYFGTNGVMVSNKTITIDGKKYTFNASGVWVK